MGYYDPDVYHQPEKFGLTQIASLDDPDACYSFGYLIVWQHEDGRMFWGEDHGCSCPSPFEGHTSLDTITEITSASWGDFEERVKSFCKPYDGDEDKIAAERTEMLMKVFGRGKAVELIHINQD